jgi:hypothetical protein
MKYSYTSDYWQSQQNIPLRYVLYPLLGRDLETYKEYSRHYAVRFVVRQPPITTIQGLFGAVFSVGSALMLYRVYTSQAVQLSEVK